MGLVGIQVLTFQQDLALFVLQQTSRRKRVIESIQAYKDTWRDIKTSVDGEDLMEMGLQPGPEFKQILGKIRGALLDGEIKPGADEQQLLKKLVYEHKKA